MKIDFSSLMRSLNFKEGDVVDIMNVYKRIILSILYFIVSEISFGESLFSGGYIDIISGGKNIVFKNSTIIYKAYDSNGKLETMNFNYSFFNDEGIDFILIDDDLAKKWLVLQSKDIIILYDNEGKPFFFGKKVGANFNSAFFDLSPSTVFSTNSYYKEILNGDLIIYSDANFTNWGEIPYPWVEGEEDYGIGVQILGDIGYSDDWEDFYLVISNGYVSYNRPDLYRKNSRVKTLKITNISTGYFEYIQVQDTPNLQFFSIHTLLKDAEKGIIIEVSDIYQGTRYKDTCINLLSTYLPGYHSK